MTSAPGSLITTRPATHVRFFAPETVSFAMAKKGKKSHAARAKAKAEESTAASPPTGDARKGVKGISF